MDSTSYKPGRSEKKERALWKVLNELDREDAAKAKRAELEKLKGVARTRKQVGVGENQSIIMEQMRVAKEKSSRVAPESTTVEVCSNSEDIQHFYESKKLRLPIPKPC